MLTFSKIYSSLVRIRNLWIICTIENLKNRNLLIYLFERTIPTLSISLMLAVIFAPNYSFWILWKYFLFVFIGFSIWNVISSCFRYNEKKFLRIKGDLERIGLPFHFFLVKYYFDLLFPVVFDLILMALIILVGIFIQEFWIALPWFVFWFLLFLVAMFSLCYLVLAAMVFLPWLKFFIDAGIRVLFFATPIFWGIESIDSGFRYFLSRFNPFAIVIAVPRQALNILQWDINTVFISISILIAFVFLGLVCYKFTSKKMSMVR